MDNNIIGAHGHQIYADGIVLVQGYSNFKFGAHPVGGGNQYRIAKFIVIEMKKPPESADTSDDPATMSGFNQLMNAFKKGFGIIYIHSRVPVCHGFRHSILQS